MTSAAVVGRDVELEEINSLDIERIEVVKGEAARALYGDRARNGLIRIETGAGDSKGG